MPVNIDDPRVRRTRQLLMQSFTELLIERKNLHSISVQDIAAKATVNRTTFYAHFEDRYAFLESWMREKFQKRLNEALPDSSISDMGSLRTLILAVFDFISRIRQHMTPADSQYERLFESAMQRELYQLLFKWLSEASSSPSKEIVEATAQIISWGIFGSALQWSRDSQDRTIEMIVRDVLVVVAAGLAPVME
ncbi:TetR/AcrR family transcriptional regulator [Paenibacillus monticola]|uniref:TetR family transcriptional regulator n=1 Tax=Paenibacillus monticola TaxID=2666075 RepID=A0A7X2H5S5_9BACL|nr:TetR/AcrR family transcriptional regulator [Paenibacillus monticola]MRN53968.1 TetR family transcriptional regulator [Paenibacillus monticola]